MNTPSRPRIGISACLLGKPVRFDSGHKQNEFVHDTLSRFVDLVPVCPEVESGMGVPRESLRLVSQADGVKLVGNRTLTDQTARMNAFAQKRVAELVPLNLDGFILKKDSPSCGLARVKIYAQGADLRPARQGTGLFAAQVREQMPSIALTEEGWLQDDALRASFLEGIFTHHRMRMSLFEAPTRGKLVEFHAAHKLLYMAHSPVLYRELGRIAAFGDDRPLQDTIDLYAATAMTALAERSTPRKHANVLEHIVGYFKTVLSAYEKQELLGLIADFRAGLQGLSVPVTLLVHHLNKHDVAEWLVKQVYFKPYPKELGTR